MPVTEDYPRDMASAVRAQQGAPAPPRLRLQLLGGFRASRDGGPQPAERWARPSARTLVKILAVATDHQLHREEIIAECWPDADPEAATRSLGVALHAARRALEPELTARQPSSYLITDGALLRLEAGAVWIDADHAERLAATALEGGGITELTAAADALVGELLPEDRYAGWVQSRRDRLAQARTRVLLQLADALLDDARAEEAIVVARELLAPHPAEERAHRTIMRAYLALGLRRQAIHQYHACREALDEELGVRPGSQTEALHRQALDSPGGAALPADERVVLPPPALRLAPTTPVRGRFEAIARLAAADATAVQIVTGEAGIGKSRVVAEAARRALDEGAIVLWGAVHDAEGHTPYGAVVEALDGWLSGRSASERARVGGEYPELAGLLPSLGNAAPGVQRSPEDERRRLFQSVAALLEDLSDTAPVVLVLDDLHAADLGTLQLLSSLARRSTISRSPWRMIATLRDELAVDDPRRAVLDALQHDGLARRCRSRASRARTASRWPPTSPAPRRPSGCGSCRWGIRSSPSNWRATWTRRTTPRSARPESVSSSPPASPGSPRRPGVSPKSSPPPAVRPPPPRSSTSPHVRCIRRCRRPRRPTRWTPPSAPRCCSSATWSSTGGRFRASCSSIRWSA